MDLDSLLKNIKDDGFIVSLVCLMCFFTPGLLIIFLFYRDLFVNLDSIKLLLLSCAIVTPYVLWGYLLSHRLIMSKGKYEHGEFLSMLTALMMGGISLYVTMLFKYILHYDIQFLLYAAWVLDTIVILFLAITIRKA